MGRELRDALEAAAERGSPRGADEVLRRAESDVAARRRRPLRLAVGGAAAALVLVAAAVGGGVLWARAKLGDVERVELAQVLAGPATSAEPRTVLVVGSDSRAGLDGEEERFGSTRDAPGERADVLLVLRHDPATGEAAALSLPRDLLVPIDGGAQQRVNTALADGPDVLVRTVQQVLGVELDHYLEVDFHGFRRIVDAVGGVSLHFETPLRDRVAGFAVDRPGCRTLDGDAALAFVRSRHLQAEVDGRWVTDPTGDLGRIRRQQQLLVSMAGDAAAARHPLALSRLLDAVSDHVTVDNGLSTDELLDLARQLGSIDAGRVRFVTVPAVAANWNGAAVLRATPDDLLAAGAALLVEPPAPPADEQAPAAPTSAPPPVAC